MLESLRKAVLEVNCELMRRGLAPFTFGNASGIDRQTERIVIKPSGVPYEALTAETMVVTDLRGRVIDGLLRPSSDLPTHVALYRAFPTIGGIVHAHSRFATVWAQARREIPCFGTTHADYFPGPIPLTAAMRDDAISGDYESNTGQVIVERFANLDPEAMQAVLVAGHASFCWGPSATAALETASILEEVAELAYHTVVLNAESEEISTALRERHFSRKHGAGAYYGQKR